MLPGDLGVECAAEGPTVIQMRFGVKTSRPEMELVETSIIRLRSSCADRLVFRRWWLRQVVLRRHDN